MSYLPLQKSTITALEAFLFFTKEADTDSNIYKALKKEIPGVVSELLGGIM